MFGLSRYIKQTLSNLWSSNIESPQFKKKSQFIKSLNFTLSIVFSVLTTRIQKVSGKVICRKKRHSIIHQFRGFQTDRESCLRRIWNTCFDLRLPWCPAGYFVMLAITETNTTPPQQKYTHHQKKTNYHLTPGQEDLLVLTFFFYFHFTIIFFFLMRRHHQFFPLEH